jgi:phosphoribosylanthranilate isomerase
VRIKICGITTAADAVRAAELGADAIGLNFYAGSKRFVDAATAKEILVTLPVFVTPVAVVVQLSMQEAVRAVEPLPHLKVVQLHGEEHPFISSGEYRFIQAFNVASNEDLNAVKEYLTQAEELHCLPAAVLIDGRASGQFGGTGKTAPWSLLADFRPPVPLILAGGLTPENVAEAIWIVRPFAVDVANGVEASPGRKDEEKMRRFIGKAREAAARASLPR